MSGNPNSHSLSRRQFAGLLAGGAITVLFGGVVPALAAPATLRGTVFYRERMAVSPIAVVTIRLEEISRGGAPSRIIAETQTRAGRSLPIDWVLRFNDRDIDPRRNYGLRAEIRDGERLLLITDSYYPVFGGAGDATDLMLIRAPAPAGPPPREPSQSSGGGDLAGLWILERMDGQRIRGRRLPELDIDDNGRVSGDSGCNRISGTVRTRRGEISFGQMATTRMACDREAAQREERFLFLLERSAAFNIGRDGESLVLMDRRDREMLRFRRG